MKIKSIDGWTVTTEPPFIRAKHRRYGDIVVNAEMMGACAALNLLTHRMDGMEARGERRMGNPR